MVPSEVVALMTFPDSIVALTISLLTRVAFSTGLLIIFPFPLLKEDVSTWPEGILVSLPFLIVEFWTVPLKWLGKLFLLVNVPFYIVALTILPLTILPF